MNAPPVNDPPLPQDRGGTELPSVASISGDRARCELQRLLMAIPAAICTTRGPEHIIETASLGWQDLVGDPDPTGKMAGTVIGSVAPAAVVDAMQYVYASGEPYVNHEVAATLHRRDGSRETGAVSIVIQPLRDVDDGVYGLMLYLVDVTEFVRSRQGEQDQAEEVQRLTQALARINRELDEFAYVASHDLKAPLRGIASLAQWIEEDIGERLGAESRKHLMLLQVRVHRMEALIDALLKYSRVGRVRNKIEAVNVGDLLTEVVEMLSPPPLVSIEVETSMPTLETERLPLHQVFLNLLTNALKHSGRPDTRIRIRAREEGDFVRFSVEDNGVGIPRHYHTKIWEIFQTLEPRDSVEGAGIGLSLVKKNVEARGGRAWLDSGEGAAGATFHFLWPKHTEQEG